MLEYFLKLELDNKGNLLPIEKRENNKLSLVSGTLLTQQLMNKLLGMLDTSLSPSQRLEHGLLTGIICISKANIL